MSRHTEEHLDLCANYALGTLDDVSRRRLEEHLREGCPQCEAALRDFGVATIALASMAPAAKPSAALRQRVMSAVQKEPRRKVKSNTGLRVATAIFAAASILFFATTVMLWTQVKKLTGEQTTMRARLDSVEQELAQAHSSVAFLTGVGTDCFDFNGTGQGDSTLVARACFSPTSGEAAVIFDHVTTRAGQDFELWVLRGDVPTSLGLVHADATGHAIVHIGSLANAGAVTAFAVSLEAAGGSTGAGPAGPVVSVGALKG